MPYDPEPGCAHAAYRSKQLVVFATDVLLERIALDGRPAAEVADVLVRERVLPACYRRRYDEPFLTIFRGVVESVLHLLVSDTPSLPDTASELAAHAILAQAGEIVHAAAQAWRAAPIELDDGLGERFLHNQEQLARELDRLRELAFEDAHVRLLFELPADEDPVANLYARLRPEEQQRLRFENWRQPFGNVPAHTSPTTTAAGRSRSDRPARARRLRSGIRPAGPAARVLRLRAPQRPTRCR